MMSQAATKPSRYIMPYQRTARGPMRMMIGSISGKGSMNGSFLYAIEVSRINFTRICRVPEVAEKQ
jgi:hypothetical protein